MNLSDSISNLKAVHRNDDGSVLACQSIKQAAEAVAKAADWEAMKRSLPALSVEQQQDAVFSAALRQIA